MLCQECMACNWLGVVAAQQSRTSHAEEVHRVARDGANPAKQSGNKACLEMLHAVEGGKQPSGHGSVTRQMPQRRVAAGGDLVCHPFTQVGLTSYLASARACLVD